MQEPEDEDAAGGQGGEEEAGEEEAGEEGEGKPKEPERPKFKIHIEEGWVTGLCPNCEGVFQCRPWELACRIFRHGVYANSGFPISPHGSKEYCDSLRESGRAIGCCKPFRVTHDGMVVKCGYI